MAFDMTDNIINYKLTDFLKKDHKLIAEYASALSFIKPVEVKKEMWKSPIRFVDFVKRKIGAAELDDMILMIAELNDITPEEVMEMRIIEFYGSIKEIKDQLENILSLEATRLQSGEANIKWEAVNGSERLSPFGLYNTLDKLSGGDVLKWEALKDMPYDQIFTKLFMDTVRGDIEAEMSKIKLKN